MCVYTGPSETGIGAVYVESGGQTCTTKLTEPEGTAIGALYENVFESHTHTYRNVTETFF